LHFYDLLAFNVTHVNGDPVVVFGFCHCVWRRKTRRIAIAGCEKFEFDDMLRCFVTVDKCLRQIGKFVYHTTQCACKVLRNLRLHLTLLFLCDS